LAFPANYNFSYYRGDSYEFVIKPKNPNGSSFSLSNFPNSLFVIATERGNPSAQVLSASPVIDALAGTITCVIDPDNGRNYLSAGPYVYDVEIFDSSGSVVYTLLTGNISVTQDVSRTGG
jgi:hypothetical protein